MALAHKLTEKARTSDVVISEAVDFSGLLLSKPVLNGLKNSGFERPSPIQLKAIPLGRCGLDLIVQAKSGTGKTCVFSVVALEGIQPTAATIQVLVLAPTREIALQIWEVICGIGCAVTGLQCHTFIGGLPLHEDKKKLQLCHIAVGTPGRIQNLIEHGALKTQSIRLFVLDEADKLLEEGFQSQINWIYSTLPDNKQMLALSATYPEYLAEHLTLYMRNPTFVRLNITDPTLLGIKQYYSTVASHPLPHRQFELKTAAVVRLLSSVDFSQCLIFSNLQTRAQNLQSELSSQGWPTSCIAGCLDQKVRITAITQLKSYACRILISTDLTSRGIDADQVNLVINLDVPADHETYLHRIGRAGRFGSYGAGVSVVSEGQELMDLHRVERCIGTHVLPLPDPIPNDLVKRQLEVHLEDVVTTEQIITRSDHYSSAERWKTAPPINGHGGGHSPAIHTAGSGQEGEGRPAGEGRTALPFGREGAASGSVSGSGCLNGDDHGAGTEGAATPALHTAAHTPSAADCGSSRGSHDNKERAAGAPEEDCGSATRHAPAPVHAAERSATPDARGHAAGEHAQPASAPPPLPEAPLAQVKDPTRLTGDASHQRSSGTPQPAVTTTAPSQAPEAAASNCSHPPRRADTTDVVASTPTTRDEGVSDPGQRSDGGEGRREDGADPNTACVELEAMVSGTERGTGPSRCGENGQPSTRRGEGQGGGRKGGKARAMGDLWASMLTEPTSPVVRSPVTTSTSPMLREERQRSRQDDPANVAGREEGEGEWVSFEKELDLYRAARAKLDCRPDNADDHHDVEEAQGAGSEVGTAAHRPISRAKHRLAKGGHAKSGTAEADHRQNGEGRGGEAGRGPEEPREDGVTTPTPGSTVPHSKDRHTGRKEDCVHGPGSEPPAIDGCVTQSSTPHDSHMHRAALPCIDVSVTRSSPPHDSHKHGAAVEPHTSEDPRTQAAAVAQSQHPDPPHQEEVAGHRVVPPPISLSLERGGERRGGGGLTFTSALRDFQHGVGRGGLPPVSTAEALVQRTFRAPQALDEGQRQQLADFLRHFQAQLGTRRRTSGAGSNGVVTEGGGGSHQTGLGTGGDGGSVDTDGGSDRVKVDGRNTSEPDDVNLHDTGEDRIGAKQSGDNSGIPDAPRQGEKEGGGLHVDPNVGSVTCGKTGPSMDAVGVSGGKKLAPACTGERRRGGRYRPMAVCGPATAHMFHSPHTSDQADSTAELRSQLVDSTSEVKSHQAHRTSEVRSQQADSTSEVKSHQAHITSEVRSHQAHSTSEVRSHQTDSTSEVRSHQTDSTSEVSSSGQWCRVSRDAGDRGREAVSFRGAGGASTFPTAASSRHAQSIHHSGRVPQAVSNSPSHPAPASAEQGVSVGQVCRHTHTATQGSARSTDPSSGGKGAVPKRTLAGSTDPSVARTGGPAVVQSQSPARLTEVSTLRKHAPPKQTPASLDAVPPAGKGAVAKRALAQRTDVPLVQNGTAARQAPAGHVGEPPVGAVRKQSQRRQAATTPGGKAQSRVRGRQAEDSEEEDSSCTSSSTSTAEEAEVPGGGGEGEVEGWMCFQNQYAVDTGARGASRGQQAATPRVQGKGRGEKVRRQRGLSPSQEDESGKKGRERRGKSGRAHRGTEDGTTGVGQHGWYPHSISNSSYHPAHLDSQNTGPPHSAPTYTPQFCPPFPGYQSSSCQREGYLPHPGYNPWQTASCGHQLSQAMPSLAPPYPSSQQTSGYPYPCWQPNEGRGYPPLGQQQTTNPSYPCPQPQVTHSDAYPSYPCPQPQVTHSDAYPSYPCPQPQVTHSDAYQQWCQAAGYQAVLRHAWQNYQQGASVAANSAWQNYQQGSSVAENSAWQNYQQGSSVAANSAWQNYQQGASVAANSASMSVWSSEAQAARFHSQQSYIQSMAKFYARFCSRDR